MTASYNIKAETLSGAEAFKKSTRRKRPPAISPVTLRLTAEERAQLEELAADVTLSAYIRACVFDGKVRQRKRRSKQVVTDNKAMAEALALLGQSRIANNLNQLAHQANIGALSMDDRNRAQIDEAYDHVLSLRAALLSALRNSG